MNVNCNLVSGWIHLFMPHFLAVEGLEMCFNLTMFFQLFLFQINYEYVSLFLQSGCKWMVMVFVFGSISMALAAI